MTRVLPQGIGLAFGCGGLGAVLGCAMMLAFIVGGTSPSLAAAVTGPVLCPAGDSARVINVRSTRGGSGPRLICTSPTGRETTFTGMFWLVWSGAFFLPLVPLPLALAALVRRQARRRLSAIGGQFAQARTVRGAGDLPPEARQALGMAASLFEDRNRDGVPDIFEGGNARVVDLRGGAPGYQAPGGGDPVEALAQLKRMLDAGLISQHEHDIKRAEILARM